MTRTLFPMTVIAMLVLAAGCSTAPSSQYKKDALEAKAEATVKRFKAQDPTLEKKFIKTAKGYAVFPSVAKGGAGLGGAYGKGVLYENGRVVGYCDLSQGSIGFQLGGQVYSELVFFQHDDALEQFKQGTIEFAAQATAVAVTAGAGANADYDKGVAVFTLGEAGLMYEASIGGQGFDYVPK